MWFLPRKKSNMSLLKVSIGIPAYNEEANIKNLLSSILAQRQDNFILEEIIVVSDGSTDRTVEAIKELNNSKIRLVESKQRLGKTVQQNSIFETAKGEINILFDADIYLPTTNILEEMIKPIIQNPQVGIVSLRIVPYKATNFFQKIMNFSIRFKTQVFESMNNADNMYLCYGRARAFSKKFAYQLKWPKVTSEDVYSYFLCKLQGYKFVYLSGVSINFRSPNNFRDYKKQSDRYKAGAKEMVKYFPSKLVEDSYRIPQTLLVRHMLKAFIKHPLLLLSYSSVVLFSMVLGRDSSNEHYLWPISGSSKSLKQDNI